MDNNELDKFTITQTNGYFAERNDSLIQDIKKLCNENKEMKQLLRFIIAELGLTKNVNKSRELIESKFYGIYPNEEIRLEDIIEKSKEIH